MDKRQDSVEELRKEIANNAPMLISRGQLRDVITPLIKELKQTIIDVMPILPGSITKDVIAAAEKSVADAIVVENKTIENTIVQEVAIPSELIDLLKLQSQALTLLKNQPKQIALDDYRAHDQAKGKATKSSFYGFGAPNGSWYIMYQKGSMQRYAAGNENYMQAWADRDKHIYSTLAEAMKNG